MPAHCHLGGTGQSPENILVLRPWGGVVPLGGDPTVNTTGDGLLALPAQAPGCRFPPRPAEGVISMGFSCRLSVLPESGACVPNAALRSRSVRRPVLRDLPKGPLVSSVGCRPGPSCCPWKGPASERSGSVRFRGGVMTTPCRASRVSKFWELGVLGKSKAGIA